MKLYFRKIFNTVKHAYKERPWDLKNAPYIQVFARSMLIHVQTYFWGLKFVQFIRIRYTKFTVYLKQSWTYITTGKGLAVERRKL